MVKIFKLNGSATRLLHMHFACGHFWIVYVVIPHVIQNDDGNKRADECETNHNRSILHILHYFDCRRFNLTILPIVRWIAFAYGHVLFFYAISIPATRLILAYIYFMFTICSIIIGLTFTCERRTICCNYRVGACAIIQAWVLWAWPRVYFTSWTAKICDTSTCIHLSHQVELTNTTWRTISQTAS